MRAEQTFGLRAPTYVVAPERIAVEQWAAEAGHAPETAEALRRSGLAYCYRARGQTIESLSRSAVAQLFEETGVDPESVDLLVYFHTIQVSIPAPPRSICEILTRELGMKRALGFSISQQNCVSFLAAMRVAWNLMRASPSLRRAVLVGADITRREAVRNIEAVGIQSDGAYAVLLEAEPEANVLLSNKFQTHGAHFDGIASDERLNAALNQTYYLQTHRLLSRLIDDSGLPRSEIKRLLPHNVNLPGWQKLVRSLKLNDDVLFADNIAAKGHFYGGDGIVNLRDCGLDPGDHYIIFSMGYGATFGAALLRR